MSTLTPVTPLADRFGRVATDLRVSLTDKCNLRCTYCMPAEGMAWMPQSSLLSAGEVIRLVDIAVGVHGVRDLRLTGGEPLIRPDLEEIVAGVRAAHPRLPIALTTNGIGLARNARGTTGGTARSRAQALRDAGLTRVNISLDTPHPETFARLTRRDRLADNVRVGHFAIAPDDMRRMDALDEHLVTDWYVFFHLPPVPFPNVVAMIALTPAN